MFFSNKLNIFNSTSLSLQAKYTNFLADPINCSLLNSYWPVNGDFSNTWPIANTTGCFDNRPFWSVIRAVSAPITSQHFDRYETGIFGHERRRRLFKSGRFITEEFQQYTNIITTPRLIK